MARYEQFTREIEQSPSGPDIGAFFDYDRTLISEFSAESFFREVVRRGLLKPQDIPRALAIVVGYLLGQQPFSSLVEMSAEVVQGESVADLEEMGARLFRKKIAGEIYPEMRAIVEAHRRKDHTTVLLSSATRYQVQDVARDLGFGQMVCNDYEVKDGRFTGLMVSPIVYGDGKLRAAEEMAAGLGLDLDRSWFYSDGKEDLPLLEEVGNPRPTNPDRGLRRVATERGWPTLEFTSRGRPTPVEVARTGALVGSLLGSVACGVPLGWLNGSQRDGINLAVGMLGDLGTAIAGIRLDVAGEDHLWEQRPAVFIFNHQSQTDVLIIAKLLRQDITGVAKAELKRNPLVGPIFGYGGIVFIHRADRERAIEELQPAVAALRNGTSLVIAPEGTRSVTPRLGRFKKGAFHMAMQAGVPVVPIVLRNTLDVLPKGRMFVRPAPVEVTVMPPVATDDWTHDTLDARIAEIRHMYEQVLES